MERSELIDRLAATQQRVTEGKEIIRKQRELIGELERDGRGEILPHAHRALEAMLEAQAASEQELRGIQEQLKSG